MDRRVGRIDELAGNETVFDFFSKFLRFGDGTLHALGTFGQNHFGTICLQNISSFHAHCFRHGQNNTVSFRGRDCCQTNTGISGCRLNDDRPFLQKSLLLRVFDHRLGDSVLDASCRIQIFQFDKQCCLQIQFLFDVCYFNQRCVADQIQCSFINFCHVIYLSLSFVLCSSFSSNPFLHPLFLSPVSCLLFQRKFSSKEKPGIILLIPGH